MCTSIALAKGMHLFVICLRATEFRRILIQLTNIFQKLLLRCWTSVIGTYIICPSDGKQEMLHTPVQVQWEDICKISFCVKYMQNKFFGADRFCAIHQAACILQMTRIILPKVSYYKLFAFKEITNFWIGKLCHLLWEYICCYDFWHKSKKMYMKFNIRCSRNS